MIKFFKKKPGKSDKLLIATRELLASHCITDKKTQDGCANVFFKSSIQIMKAIANQKNIDWVLNGEMHKIKVGLIKAGIVDTEKQDEMILEFYQLLGETAGIT